MFASTFLITRSLHLPPIFLPLTLMSIPAMFHLVLLATGTSLEWCQEHDWVMRPMVGSREMGKQGRGEGEGGKKRAEGQEHDWVMRLMMGSRKERGRLQSVLQHCQPPSTCTSLPLLLPIPPDAAPSTPTLFPPPRPPHAPAAWWSALLRPVALLNTNRSLNCSQPSATPTSLPLPPPLLSCLFSLAPLYTCSLVANSSGTCGTT